MTYGWRCANEKCGAVTEVIRRMSESHIPPWHSCRNCGNDTYKKVLTAPQIHIPGGRSEAGVWPVVLAKQGQPILRGHDENGLPIIERPDVVFKNQAEQDRWLEANGKARLADYEDPAIGESQHSHFHQGDTPPPTARSLQLAKDITFKESPKPTHDDDGRAIPVNAL